MKSQFEIFDEQLDKNFQMYISKPKDKYNISDIVFDTHKRKPRCLKFDAVKDEIKKMQFVKSISDDSLIDFYARSIIKEDIEVKKLKRRATDCYTIYIELIDHTYFNYHIIIIKIKCILMKH